ncbi:MAG: chemotaxis protein CheW [Myxococcota bacterium]
MSAAATIDERSQYLTFEVGEDLYAIGILELREIISFKSATRVPMAPRSIRGLINLRGSAVPVVDLAIEFGSEPTAVSKRTCVVILDAGRSRDGGTIGILADSVREVIELSSAEIEETPEFGLTASPDYLVGLARIGEAFVPILEVQSLLSAAEVALARDGSGRDLEALLEAGASDGVAAALESASPPGAAAPASPAAAEAPAGARSRAAGTGSAEAPVAAPRSGRRRT